MLEMLMEARALTDDWRYAHVGELLFKFCMVARHLNPQEHIRLWHWEDRLVGYAMLGEDPSFDWQVLPAFEWQGIENDALAWVEDLVEELRRREAESWGGALISGARQDDARRIDFLEKNGFSLGGEFSEVNMLRRLDEPIPAVIPPAGCHVRVMNDESDIPQRAEAHREVWLPWSDGNMSNEDYAYFKQLPGYEQGLDVVAVAPDGVMAAFVNGWNDRRNRIGDLGPVGARPAYRRQGMTQAVLLECLRRMQSSGMDRACVSTGVSNAAAIRLYESIGFRIVNQYNEYIKPGSREQGVKY